MTGVQTCALPICVFKLPLGMMNIDTALALCAEIGDFMDADTDEEGMAYGQYMRIKVRMEITKPLMRGKMIQVGWLFGILDALISFA